ncbi:MAG: four helix bundle protein [Planctomycetales bacterium]|nr:four helix bundle protein [Planctomycetales bacterium]
MSDGRKSKVYQKAYAFSIRMVKLYQYLCEHKKEYVLSKQLLRCGTSIGANIAEANGAISEDDFSHKMPLSYKECLETKYWLSLLKDTGYLLKKEYESLFADADEIAKMLFSVLKATRINK